MQKLLLDPALRNWVLLPIMFVMILIGILRHNATILLQSSPKKLSKEEIREQRLLQRAYALRACSNSLLPESIEARKCFLIESLKSGKYLKPVDPNAPKAANPLMDDKTLEGLMESMKGNMLMVVPQTIIMTWINEFFSGFILLKLPFPLTLRFKSIFQSGVATQDLDVQWVSSISWYFLNLFGLKSVYALLLGENNAASNATNEMGMAGFSSAAATAQLIQPGQDISKMMLSEAENVQILKNESLLVDVEKRLLAQFA
ncbi:hypothetical protein POMI540_0453 [Schizosaccharomyces pombe]|uniref:ER membrane protein complex subunit 3 n=1 Tax=Schizosaccharomyces pombe (strain 972 / ATCC 24843) TaxID=284812 RepID=YNY3_SCHPO|nr:putative protein Aim27 [Schizosaccharomyces pombe]Q9P787.1 RecName: Full=ER membrane protein complex subunit 3 [Schizosaccharomyces pombe 972h-]CAB88233.1 ER membrane protein complex subunit Aim27 (predicted) [Schizosaccharomyces pombe]|eukprot:NP_595876.1 putative protein Aim27 [Schizosaccharomyces pombe]